MNTEDLLSDIKQLLQAELSQVESRIGERLSKIENNIHGLEGKLDDGFATIAEIMTSTNDQFDNHETRITSLEAA